MDEKKDMADAGKMAAKATDNATAYANGFDDGLMNGKAWGVTERDRLQAERNRLLKDYIELQGKYQELRGIWARRVEERDNYKAALEKVQAWHCPCACGSALIELADKTLKHRSEAESE